MSLKTQMAADSSLFLNISDFGEEVAYQKKDGTVLSALPLLFIQGQTMVGGQLVVIETNGTAIFAASAVTPGAGDFFTRDNGEVWKIDRNSPPVCDGVYWRIKVIGGRLAVLGG